MTTHSDIPLVELRCSELRVVMSQGGITTAGPRSDVTAGIASTVTLLGTSAANSGQSV